MARFGANIFLHHFCLVTLVWAATRLSEPLQQTIASMELLRQISTQGLATMDKNGGGQKILIKICLGSTELGGVRAS